MKYTKATFEMVANIIKQARNLETQDGRPVGLDVLARTFANKFAESNPLFDRARFLKACGIGS